MSTYSASYWIQELKEVYRDYRPESWFKAQHIIAYLYGSGIMSELNDDEYDEIYDIEKEVHENKNKFMAA